MIYCCWTTLPETSGNSGTFEHPYFAFILINVCDICPINACYS